MFSEKLINKLGWRYSKVNDGKEIDMGWLHCEDVKWKEEKRSWYVGNHGN